MRAKKVEIPQGVGLLIKEVVEQLQHKHYNVTAQQIRQYEDRYKLYQPIRTKGNYREYTPILISKIEFILRLEMIGFPKKRIKDFVLLKEKIKNNPNIKWNQEWDKERGVACFVGRLSSGVKEGSTEYNKLQLLVGRYIDLCKEIEERFKDAKTILEEGLKDVEGQAEYIKKITK